MAPQQQVHPGVESGLFGMAFATRDYVPGILQLPTDEDEVPLPEPDPGSLLVTISAPAPAGAQWRRVGESLWRNSGVTETGVPAGKHLIEFKDGLSGYHAPTLRTAEVSSNQVTTLVVRYQAHASPTVVPQAVTDSSLRTSGAF